MLMDIWGFKNKMKTAPTGCKLACICAAE